MSLFKMPLRYVVFPENGSLSYCTKGLLDIYHQKSMYNRFHETFMKQAVVDVVPSHRGVYGFVWDLVQF